MKQYAMPDCLYSSDIKRIRKKLNLTQKDFSTLLNVSVKTVERWESTKMKVTGAAIPFLMLLDEKPQLAEQLEIPRRKLPLRLWYMCGEKVCTLIDVDERQRKMEIRNYTDNFLYRAFGCKENPDYEDYEAFLESRCFPASRDKMKIILKELDIPYYDPFLIIEKTEGRMAEDQFWIRIER